ncbi:MAG: sugar phosphate isomerase/epimerase family protein [Clostridia bacterium]
MKFSFSTLGCPDWKWTEILSTAKDLGYNGIEIRGIGDDIYAPDIKIFNSENIETTKKSLLDKDLTIACLSSSCYLHLEDKDYLSEAKSYIDLADKLNAKGVRVMGETSPEPSDLADDDKFIKALIVLCDYAKDKFPDIYIETNGVYAKSERLLSIIKAVNSPKLKVIWDFQHPVRNYNEPVEVTYNNLKEYIAHVHIKDSVVRSGKLEYKMVFSGDLPIKEALTLLKADDYQGFISLEWVKRWNRELEDPGIVFSNFIYSIKSFLA